MTQTRRMNFPRVNLSESITPVELGGTGAISLTQAALNLNLVTSVMKGVPNGFIPLNGSGQIESAILADSLPTPAVNVDGNLNVYASAVSNFVITDYDSFKNYVITVSAGTFVRTDDVITYTAPATAQTVTLTVNGRQYSLTVLQGQPIQPSIVVPVNGTNGTNVSLTYQASAFSYSGAPDTHASSDWQIATDAAFTNIVRQTTDDTVNKTSWTPAALSNAATYYVRVRYKGASGNYSIWSNVSTFTTVMVAPVLTLYASINGQAQAGFFQEIGTYTGTVTNLAVLTGPGAVTYSNGKIYYNGNMPYFYNGSALQITVSNNGGSSTDDMMVYLTPQPDPAPPTTVNWTFPVNSTIAPYSGGRKSIAYPDILFAQVASGSLPPGCELIVNQGSNRDVLISGTPSQAGTYNFTLSGTLAAEYSANNGFVTGTITITITP